MLISSEIFFISKLEITCGGKAFKIYLSESTTGSSFSWLTGVDSGSEESSFLAFGVSLSGVTTLSA